jgi:hypothetical protein
MKARAQTGALAGWIPFNEDQSRLRKGHGAKNMAVVRHFAMNLVRQADEALRPERQNLRRKLASWSTEYLSGVLGTVAC